MEPGHQSGEEGEKVPLRVGQVGDAPSSGPPGGLRLCLLPGVFVKISDSPGGEAQMNGKEAILLRAVESLVGRYKAIQYKRQVSPAGNVTEIERSRPGGSKEVPPPVLLLHGKLQIVAENRLRHPVLLLRVRGLLSSPLLLVPLS